MAVTLIQCLASGMVDSTGTPLAAGTVTSYSAGTTTLATLYSDYACSSPLANPSTLDNAGRLTAYASGLVKLVVQDSDAVVTQTLDYVGVA